MIVELTVLKRGETAMATKKVSDSQITFTLRVDRETGALLSAITALNHISVTAMLRKAVDDYIADNKHILKDVSDGLK
jgi:predicted transcriptional regulator